MKSFDEWFKSEMPNTYKKKDSEKIEALVYSVALAAWNVQQAKIDEALTEMMNQLDHDYDDMERPDYDAMRYALINIKGILNSSS